MPSENVTYILYTCIPCVELLHRLHKKIHWQPDLQLDICYQIEQIQIKC